MARHAHMVEGEPAVVYAVQSHLLADVFNRYARCRIALRIANRRDKRMHTVRRAVNDQLRKDRRQPAVARSVADIIFAGVRVWRVNDKLLSGCIVVRRGLQVAHIGAMTSFGHSKGAHDAHCRNLSQVAPMMIFRA